MRVPALSAPIGQLSGIAAISQDDVWAVGRHGSSQGEQSTTLTLHWNGAQWSVVPSPNGSTSPSGLNYLYGVAATGPRDVWAVGASAEVGGHFHSLVLHWDGSSWRVTPAPNPGLLDNIVNDIAAIAPDDAWAVGSYLSDERVDPHMMFFHWDGKAWLPVAAPRDSTHNLLTVKALSKNSVWAAGTQVLHWDGRKWSIQTTPADYSGGYLDGMAVTGPDDVWISGNDGNNSVAIHWDGTSWKGVKMPKLADGPFPHELAAISKSDVWAAGEYSDNPAHRQLLLLHWDGQQWEAVPNPLPAADTRLQGLSTSGTTVWAAGTQGSDVASRPLLLRYTPSPCAPSSPVIP